MPQEKYNGWTNYETWNVNLWIDNEQSSQEYWREQADEVYAETVDHPDHPLMEIDNQAAFELSQRIKADYEDNAPTVSGAYADLLNGALSEVNWYEIAKHMIDARENY
jgi:hypothetical protein